eukprot:m51a1_g1098 hypothetical protein (86) ;mRNA; r:96624-96949
MVARLPQYLCEFAKSEKNVKLAKNVPRAKRTMELIIYFVKAVLSAHSMLSDDSFSIASLKHKGIDGVSRAADNYRSSESSDSNSD